MNTDNFKSHPLPKGRGFIDLTGKTLGQLTVLSFAGYSGKSRSTSWYCKCQCGTERTFYSGNIRRSKNANCGCVSRKLFVAFSTKHGCSSKGGKRTPEYTSWKSMRSRCLNPKDPAYNRYGGRGIKVHPQWINSFETFLSDMGEKPTPKHTLDRIKNNSDYTPENCRWATYSQQARNTRSNNLITFGGKTQCLKGWSEEVGLKPDTIWRRLKRGWTIEKSLTEPLITQNK